MRKDRSVYKRFTGLLLEVVPKVDSVDLFARRGDLLAQLLVVGLCLLIGKVGLS